jgi:hypothetical protein
MTKQQENLGGQEAWGLFPLHTALLLPSIAPSASKQPENAIYADLNLGTVHGHSPRDLPVTFVLIPVGVW